MGNNIYIYYFTAAIAYVLFAVGFCIQVFKKYHINYVFIFELTNGADQYRQYYTQGFILLAVWMVCFTAQMAQFKLDSTIDTESLSIFSLILLISYAFIFFNPFDINSKQARIQLIKTLE